MNWGVFRLFEFVFISFLLLVNCLGCFGKLGLLAGLLRLLRNECWLDGLLRLFWNV